MAEQSVLEKRKQLTYPVASGFPKVLSQTPPLSPVPEGSVLGAVFRQENNIASVLNRSVNGLSVGDDIPGFDPLPFVPTQYFDYADKYIGLTNVDQVNRMNEIIRGELNDKAIMYAHPWRSMAYGAVSGVADFPGLLMPGGVLYNEYKLGSSIAKSALSTGIASLVAGTIDETMLYNSQYTRSVQESINNVAIRTILGSVLGGIGGYYAGRNAPKILNAATKEASDIYEHGQPTYQIEYKEGKYTVTNELPAPKPTGTPPKNKDLSTQGESWRTSGDGTSNVPTRLNQVMPGGSYPETDSWTEFENVFTSPDSNINPFFTDTVFDESQKISGLPSIMQKALKHNPYVRLKTSPLNSANFIGDMLFDTATGTVATDVNGIAKPVNLQGLIYSNYWQYNSHLIDIQDIFHKQAGNLADAMKSAEKPKGLSATEFAEELSYYLRNRSVKSPNKDVARAVEIAITKILDPMRKEAVELGKLGEFQEVEDYLMRIWNRPYVVENQQDLSKLLYGYYKEVNEVLRESLPKMQTFNDAISRSNQLLQDNIDMRADVETFTQTIAVNQNDLLSVQKDLAVSKARITKDNEVIANKKNFLSQRTLDINEDIKEIQTNAAEYIKTESERLNNEITFLKEKKIKALRGAAQQDKTAAFVERLTRRYEKEIMQLEKDLAKIIRLANRDAQKEIEALKKQLQKIKADTSKDIKNMQSYVAESKQAVKDAAAREAVLIKEIAALNKNIAEFNNILKAQPDDVILKSLEMFESMLKTLQTQDIYGVKTNHLVHDDGTMRTVMEDHELLANANETLLTILSYGDDALESSMMSKIIPQSGKPLKSRKIHIHDNYLGNFIKKDGFEILSRYIKAMNPVISAVQYSKGLGVNNLEEATALFKKTVRDEYLSKSMGMDKKAANKLEKHLSKIIQDVDDSVEIIMNVYGTARNNDAWYVKFLQHFRTFNTIRLMGSMALSSLTDIGTMSIRSGPFQLIYESIIPLLKSKELRAMSKEDLRALGFALNHQNGQIIKSAADTGSLVVQPNKFSGIMDRVLQGFGNVTLINQWSNLTEMMGGTLSTNNILKSIETVINGGTLSPRDTKWLNRLGIGKEHYQTIYDLWQEHGGTLVGTRYSNHQKWILKTPEQAAAFNAFRMALSKDMRHMLVRPGPETKPKAMYSEAGKTFFQFKSYYFAATDKVLMSSIQDRGDMETITGLMVLLSIGALQYVITSYTNDREPDLSIGNLCKESVDRTGILGIYAEYYNIFAKLNLIPGLGTTRYQTRGIAGALGGPTVGALDDFATAMGKINQAVTDGRPLTAKDYSVMLRLMPYQNLFYTRRLSRYLLGIEESKAGAPIEPTRFMQRKAAEFNQEGRKR